MSKMHVCFTHATRLFVTLTFHNVVPAELVASEVMTSKKGDSHCSRQNATTMATCVMLRCLSSNFSSALLYRLAQLPPSRLVSRAYLLRTLSTTTRLSSGNVTWLVDIVTQVVHSKDALHDRNVASLACRYNCFSVCVYSN